MPYPSFIFNQIMTKAYYFNANMHINQPKLCIIHSIRNILLNLSFHKYFAKCITDKINFSMYITILYKVSKDAYISNNCKYVNAQSIRYIIVSSNIYIYTIICNE